MKYFQQLDISDCGAACLAMIASKYRKYSSIAKIREIAGTDILGTNLNGMVQAGEKLGFNTYAVKGTIYNLNSKTPLPFIAHIHVPDEYGTFNEHFVVVTKVTKNKINIWNPDPLQKKQWISKDKFAQKWSGYAIFMEPKRDFTPEKESDNFILRFLPMLTPHRKTLCFIIICSFLLVFFGIITSLYYKYLFDEIIISKAKLSLATLSLGVLLVGIVQLIISLIRSILLMYFSFKNEIQLDFSYLNHIFKLPLSFFESRKTGEILSRLQDLATVRNVLSNSVLSVFLDCSMIILIIPILIKISKPLFLIDLLSVLLTSLIILSFSFLFKKIYAHAMSKKAEVNSFLVERINGISTLKALNAEDKTFEDYEKKQLDVIKTDWKGQKYSILQTFISGIISTISSISIYWIGSNCIIDNYFSLGTLISFNTLATYFNNPISRIVNLQISFQQAIVASKRVGEILDLATEEERKNKKLLIPVFKGHISCKNIFFRYGSKPLLYENFSIDIPSGSWAAFVGPTGCGKTTFVKLLLKFYTFEKGSLKIDGYNIQDIDTNFLREKIGYVPQDIFLFSGTIQENISLHYPHATYEQIVEAAKRSGADEFIEKLPQRYNTYLGQNGNGLSGGEKQKIALARALLCNPSLLILDEATSNLDSISEQSLYHVLKKLRKDSMTIIIIAHRLTTIKDCDIIYVMSNGKVVEQGNHKNLIEKNGLYKKLWEGMVM